MLKGTKITDWLAVGLSAVALAVTLGYISPKVDGVRDTAVDAQNSANQAVGAVQTISERQNKIEETTQVEQGTTQKYVVQLATYRRENCTIAEAEVLSYHDRFNPSPTLLTTSNNSYVVIGITVENYSQAKSIKDIASELSKESQFKNESLDEAIIQQEPNWTILPNC